MAKTPWQRTVLKPCSRNSTAVFTQAIIPTILLNMQYSARIPQGSWILVTGVNGLVASHTAQQALKAGYKVRGTVRDAGKNQWMRETFDEKYGPGNFELVTVKDLAADGAFDDAIKGKWSSCTLQSHLD